MEYAVGNRVLNEWQIVREIGSGASGRVWEIEKIDHGISITSALKIIQVPQDPSMKKILYSDGMDDRSVTQFFQNVVDDLTKEIKFMIDMKGFPYIVNCEDYSVIHYPGEIKWDILIRMELLTPIQTYTQNHILSEADILKMSGELLQTLMLFEERGIIHRDIKPGNIFVDKYGNFKIGDFGIARICDRTSANLSKKGTLNYMAPEVFHGGDYGHTVDIYSLGLVLYKLLNNNRLPFYPDGASYSSGDMQQALIDRMSGKKEMPLPKSASPEFGKIVRRMCAHNPEDRYQNAAEIVADLEQIKGSVKGVSSHIGNPTGKVNRNLEETKPFFENGRIRDKEAAKRTGETELKSSSGLKVFITSSTLTEVTHQSVKQKPVTKKAILKALSAISIITAVVLYYFMSKSYTLNVVNGSGSGTYKGGEEITVTAEDVFGSTFMKWEVTGNLSLTDEELVTRTLSFKMPRSGISLKALYSINNYKVTVHNGSGTGDYNVGEEVSITADEEETGKEFSRWDVDDGLVDLEHADKPRTSFTMPDENVEISAIYRNLQYSLQVENGEGSGNYEYNKSVRIMAQEKSGQTFREWVVLEGEFEFSEEQKTMPEVSIDMPACDLLIRAEYVTIQNGVAISIHAKTFEQK